MDFNEWAKAVPLVIREDVLWRLTAYRAALFIADLGWEDVTCLAKDRRSRAIADQLYRALCGISPNIAEGYSRGSGKDRARFYEYSLGSVRESIDWYFKSRHVLTVEVAEHRIGVLIHIRRLLLTMVPQQRASMVREERSVYSENASSEFDHELAAMLETIPMPPA